MHPQETTERQPDPTSAPPTHPGPLGSRRVWRLPKVVLWIITLGLLGVTVMLQRPDAPSENEVHLVRVGLEPVRAPKRDVLILLGKLQEAMTSFSPPNAVVMQQQIDASAGYGPDSPFGGKQDPKDYPAVDRLRVIMLGARALSAEVRDARLSELHQDLDPESVLKADIETLRRVWESGGDPSAPGPDQAQIDALKKRHGWFAEMALSWNDPNAPVRTAAASDGKKLLVLMFGLFGLVGLALLVGLVLLITGLILSTGKSWSWRFRPGAPGDDWPNEAGQVGSDPRPGAGVWLETVAVFLASFLALKLVGMALEHVYANATLPSWLPWVSILGQWLCLLAIFWPLARGMDWPRWKREIGWHRGRGAGHEVLAGVGGYLAGLPIYFGMALIMVLVMLVVSMFTKTQPMPANKVVDLVEGGSPLALLAVFLLATIWAPIVEESIFRGALYGHLRRRVPLLLAAVGSAAVFAMLHGYLVMQLFIVGTLGFWFAVVREWRGSLIACATGHFIHNAVVLGAIITLLSFAQG